MPRVRPAPASVRVGEVDLNAVHGLGFVLLLCLEDELLQDRVVARNDGDREHLAARVVLATALDTEPVTFIIDRMRRVGRRLENNARLDSTRRLLIFLVVVTK